MSTTAFGPDKIGAQKIKKQFFFQDKFYSLKAQAHYFTVLINLATWRAAKLGIFTRFTSINLLQCIQSINALKCVYYTYHTDTHLFYEHLVLVVIAVLCTTVAQKNSVHIIIYIYIYIYLIYLSYISYIIYRHLIQTFLSVCTFIYEPYSIKPYFTETMIYVKLDAEAANTAHSYYLYFLYFNEQYIIYIYIYIAIE